MCVLCLLEIMQIFFFQSKAIIAMILSHALCIGCAQAAYAFVDPIESTWLLPMYIAVTRLGFSAGLSVIIILCVSNNGGNYCERAKEIFWNLSASRLVRQIHVCKRFQNPEPDINIDFYFAPYDHQSTPSAFSQQLLGRLFIGKHVAPVPHLFHN